MEKETIEDSSLEPRRETIYISPADLIFLRKLLKILKVDVRIIEHEKHPTRHSVQGKFPWTDEEGDITISETDADIIVFEEDGNGYIEIMSMTETGAHMLESGESIKIDNRSPREIRISLTKSSGGSHCAENPITDDDYVLIDSGKDATLQLTVDKAASECQENQKSCKYDLKIECLKNSEWEIYTGQGGGPHLIVEPPGGP